MESRNNGGIEVHRLRIEYNELRAFNFRVGAGDKEYPRAIKPIGKKSGNKRSDVGYLLGAFMEEVSIMRIRMQEVLTDRKVYWGEKERVNELLERIVSSTGIDIKDFDK